jgi:hypothetical protein
MNNGQTILFHIGLDGLVEKQNTNFNTLILRSSTKQLLCCYSRPADKDMLETSDLIKIVETFRRKLRYAGYTLAFDLARQLQARLYVLYA